MSETTTTPVATRSGGGFTTIAGWIIAVIGIVFIIAGGTAYVMVHNELVDEKITVAEDASMFAGQDVAGPFTAYAQAEVIKHHALDASGGKTYAELGRDDPVRGTVMNASFLRASLFTSVVAFGVAAMAIAVGITQVLGGLALTMSGRHRA